MKKIIVFLALIHVLAACNSGTSEPAPNEIDEEQEVEQVDDTEETDAESPEKEQPEDEAEEDAEGPEVEEEDNSPAEEKPTAQWNKEKAENADHQAVVDLAYDIFAAQDKKDYAFLQSVAANEVTVDEANNKFIFDHPAYSFEMDFFTKEELGKLELRYTHEEDDTVIVGFSAIDTANESSFVVDYEFVQENGKWKMKTMDVNK